MPTRSELVRAATPEALDEFVRHNAPVLHETAHAHGHGAGHGAPPMESRREATHRGHRITIRTTYHIEVDGVPLAGHMAVTNDGRVHYHAMPNVSFDSAVDLVKQLIDAFPDDFGPAPGPAAGPVEPSGRAGEAEAAPNTRRRSTPRAAQPSSAQRSAGRTRARRGKTSET